jgi:hypothetical protein
MRLTNSIVSRPSKSFSVAALVTTLLLSGCGSSGEESGTGGSGGKRDSGMGGSGGLADAAPISGTGGTPGTGGMVGTGGVSTLDAGMGGNVTVDANHPSVDVGIDSGIVPADVALDKPISDAADATPIDVSLVTEVGTTEGGLSGGSCLVGKWDKMLTEITSIAGLASDKDGNLFGATSLANPYDFGTGTLTSTGSADLVVFKLDPSTGNAVWAKLFGDSADQNAGQLAVAKTNQIGVIGTFTGTLTAKDTITNAAPDPLDFIIALDNDGNGKWAKSIDTKTGGLLAIAASPAQDAFAVCGYTTGAATDLVSTAMASSDGKEDILLAKLDANTGAILWSRQIGGVGMQLCAAVTMDTTGNVYAAGVYNQSLDFGSGALPLVPGTSAASFWIAKFDATTGATSAAKSWGNDRQQALKAIAIDNAGSLAIVGAIKGSVTFGSYTVNTASSAAGVDGGTSVVNNTDAFAVKLDSSLNPVWARNWGDTANQDVRSAGFDSKGDLILAGSLVGTIDLGNGTVLTSVIGADSYLTPKPDAFWMKVRGDTGAGLCGNSYGDAYSQQASLLTVSPAVSGSQADAVTLAGYFGGIMDFGLASGSLIAGVPGTSSASHIASFLYQMTP